MTVTRQGWPDVAKGLCIVLVVFWHVVTKHVQSFDWGQGSAITDFWIFLNVQLLPLRMPLFFVVSGVFAARAVAATEAGTVLRRASRLFLLYVTWVLLQTAALALTPDFETARAQNLLELLAQLTFNPTNLWYLFALAAYLVLGRLTRGVPTVPLLMVAFVISATAATGVVPDSGNLWQVVQNLFFFVAGLRCRAMVLRVADRASALRLLALGGAYATGLALMSLLTMRAWFGAWLILSTAAVLFGVTLCVLIDRHLKVVSASMRWMGRRTLPIYVIHMIPLAILDQLLRSPAVEPAMTGVVLAVVEPPLMTAVVIGACLGIYWLLGRVGLGALFDPLAAFERARAGSHQSR